MEQTEEVAGIGLEIIDDVLNIETQLNGALAELADAQLERLVGPEDFTLKDKYDLKFDPETTIPAVGRQAMGAVLVFAVSPDLVREEMIHGAVAVVDKGDNVIDFVARKSAKEHRNDNGTVYRANNLAYAQDQEGYKGYAHHAEAIIDALICGDDSLARGLSPRFYTSLVNHLNAFKDGLPDVEREALISVACNGLAELDGKLWQFESDTDDEEQFVA